MKPTCPVCDSATLEPETHDEELFFNGRNLTVKGLENFRCTTCGADPVFPEQVRRNHQKITEAKRHSEGLLSGEAIRAIRERAGMSQADAAKLFGGGPNAFSKYERGEVVQSLPMDRLLRVACALPQAIHFLRQHTEATTTENKYEWPQLEKFGGSVAINRDVRSTEIFLSTTLQ